MSVYTYTRAGGDARVHAAVPNTLNFQARLLKGDGSIVSDGTYSISFNLYATSSGGVAVWNEVHASTQVRSGYLSVYLGSIDNDLDTLDWSQQYWLTMNVNGDGEMNPRLMLTSVPYAFRSSQSDSLTNGAGTLSANDLVHLSPSSVQAVNTALAALRINQTGTGLLAQLQGDGSDVFTISKSGAVNAASLNLQTGGLQVAGTEVLTSSRALQNVTGISTSGGLVFNSFSGSSGIMQVDAAGNVSLATAGTTYEVPVTFGNGLTRAGNAVSLGGTLSAATDIALSGNNFTFSGLGNVGIGTNSPTAAVLDIVRNANVVFPSLKLHNGNGGANAYAYGYYTSDSAGGLFGVGPGSASISNLSDATYAVAETTASGGLVLSSRAASAGGIRFYTNGTETNERMRIDASGNVNIGGDATPDALFTVGSGSAFQVNNSGSVLATGLNNSSGGITNAGSITGVGLNVTASAALTISSGGSGALTLDSASNALVLAANDTSILRTAAGDFTLNLSDGALTRLVLNNGGAGAMNLNLQDGGLEVAGTVVLTNARVLQNVTFDTGLITSGTLGVARGGTGLNTLTTNGVLFASGTGTITQAVGTSGQVLLANASNVPTFTTLSGDITINSSGATTVGANSVALGTDTTGNYVSTISVGNGLSVSGVGAENATATLGIVLPTSGTTSTTSSNSGLELTASGLSLFRGCSNGQVMEWNGGAGEWNCATDNTGLSDSTIKTNVTSIGSVLDTMKNINVVDFNFKCNDALWLSYRFTCADQTGILAQDLALQFPDLVSLRSDGLHQVDFGRLNMYTLKAVTEVANFIEADGDGKLTNVYTGNTLRLSSSGTLQNINGLTVVSGGASITGGIDNNSGGITETGAVSGVTILSASGLASLSGGATISGGTISLNAGGLLTNTNINTGVSTGTVTIGGGAAALVIDSSAFDVSSTGALSGLTTLNMSGLATVGGGATISGGAINLNAGGLLTNTNINTGASTGTVTIGGGTASLVINSTNFDVSSTGAVSGVTTLDTSGNITSGGVYRIVQAGTTYTGAGTITCANNNYLGGMVVRGGIITSYGACNGVGLSDERLKTNVQQLSSTLDTIGNVNLVTFDFDCENQAFEIMNESCKEDRQTGVLAQQLATVFPELVYQDEFGYYRVKYDALNIYTLKAVAEVAKSVDSEGNVKAKTVAAGGVVRLDENGVLKNINGLQMVSGGASITGGIDNNYGGLSEVGEVTGVTTLVAQRIVLNANGTEHLLELKKDGSGVFTVFNNGALELKLDSYQSFSIKDTAGVSVFSIDTINGQIRIGNGDPNKTVLFTLDNRDAIDDPPGTNGASYYNTKLQRFRCYQEDAWTDCLPVGNLTDPITLSRTVWSGMPNAESEFPGEPRILPNLKRAHEFKLRMRITTAAYSNATCRLQFAVDDNGPWEDLSDTGAGELKIDKAGTMTTDWLKLKAAARDEVVVRVVCKGGNGSVSPVFYGVSVQLR